MQKTVAIIVLTANLMISHFVMAQSTATQIVTCSVGSIDVISVSGEPPPLVIENASAGNIPPDVVDTSTTYAVTTNNSSRKIYGSISFAWPFLLSIQLTPPNGATSTGPILLSTTPQSLVTGITNIAQGSLPIMYILHPFMNTTSYLTITNIVIFTIGP